MQTEDDSKSIEFLVQHLSTMAGKRDIIYRYSPNMNVQLRWTVWFGAEQTGDEEQQIGAGSSLMAAMHKSYDNMVRDIFKDGPPDA